MRAGPRKLRAAAGRPAILPLRAPSAARDAGTRKAEGRAPSRGHCDNDDEHLVDGDLHQAQPLGAVIVEGSWPASRHPTGVGGKGAGAGW